MLEGVLNKPLKRNIGRTKFKNRQNEKKYEDKTFWEFVKKSE